MVFYGYGDHRDLHVLTHSFPTRRSSDLGHEFGGPGLCRACAELVCGKAQMPRERRLDAGAVKDIALNGRTIDNLLRDEFDSQAIALIGRSEERRVGNECARACRYRGRPYYEKKKDKHTQD